MKEKKKKKSEEPLRRVKIQDQTQQTYLTAFLLVIMTLGIFATQQNKGPESAVALFNYAVQNHDSNTVKSLTASTAYPTSASILNEEVSHFFILNAEYESGLVRHKDGYDFVELIYDFPNGKHLLTVWVVSKTSSGWKIHPDKTIELWKNSLGLF